MNAIEHRILRARPNTPGLAGAAPTKLAAPSKAAGQQSATISVDSFTPGPILDEAFPDISGFANYSKGKLLAVRDNKDTDPSPRILLVDKNDGAVSPVTMDWSRTGLARDLEAVAPGSKRGQFLAVEGSSYGEKKSRLFELSVAKGGGKAEKSHVLPEFGQEIEGMVSVKGRNGAQTVLFAGRGGEGQQSKIYWGELSEKGLKFSSDGLQGQTVQAPQIGPGQRDIADLSADKNGNLWATAALDHGDDGPFTSSLYQLGQLTPGGSTPFTPRLGKNYTLSDVKAEAISVQSDGRVFIGSDNESAGGRFESVLV